MSIIVSRPIFNIRANYVEIFVKISAYSGFSRWKMYFCANLHQNLYEIGGSIFGIFNPKGNVYNGAEADFDSCQFKRSANSGFSRWKMYVCTNLSQNPLRRRVRHFRHF